MLKKDTRFAQTYVIIEMMKARKAGKIHDNYMSFPTPEIYIEKYGFCTKLDFSPVIGQL